MSRSFSLAVVVLLMTTASAQAYVDPGSGSVIVTTLLGIAAAIGYTCRKYFYRMKRMFMRSTHDDSEKSED